MTLDRFRDRHTIYWIAPIVVLMLVGGLVILKDGPDGGVPGANQAPVECPIDPPNGEAAISSAILSCPDRSIVRFPAGRQYTTAGMIDVRDRRNLTIDGNGSTFTSSADGTTTQAVNPVWLVLRGHDITLKNMTVVGSFDIPGPRDLSKLQRPRFTEAAPGFGLYGADNVNLIDVKALRVWGDGVTTGPSHYADPAHFGENDFTRNVMVDRMTVETVGRMCWGPTSGENIVIQNSSCKDAWYGGIDAEADGFNQPIKGHKYLNNTFDGYGNFGIFVPVAGDPGNTRDIEIRGNKFLTGPDKDCSATIGVGGYAESNPRTFENVIVAENQIRFMAVAVWLDHVNSGLAAKNTLDQLPPPAGYTHIGWCGVNEPVRITNSTGVVVDGNL